MKMILFLTSLITFLISGNNVGAHNSYNENDLIVLCYHHISELDTYDMYHTVSRKNFMRHLEFLKAHGYNFVSVQEIVDAKSGEKALPKKPVLLSFDDSYKSFYEFVFPVLKEMGYPSMLAVVGDWIDNNKPRDIPGDLMTWKEIEEVSRSGLVEIASHSYKLHEEVQYTPAGNVAAKATSRQYFRDDHRYESEDEYRNRLLQDFLLQNERIAQHIGNPPRAMVWPYGRYNAIAVEIARDAGMLLTFNLDAHHVGRGLNDPLGLNRIIVDNWDVDFFAYMVRTPKLQMEPMRAVQVDLDLIYAPGDSTKTEENLGRLIERLVAMGVNTVFLQGFSDPDGSGNIRSVYFHNRVLPVTADIFGHATHQIGIRGITVFAWMPTLSFIFPDQTFNNTFAIQEYKDGKIGKSSSWYKRLTPFSAEVREKVGMLYEDLAAYSQISGILFQDDAYLNDYEDMNPIALDQFSKKTGRTVAPNEIMYNKDIQHEWINFKKNTLNNFINDLFSKAKKYRPDLYSARNIYANILIQPESESWFAQNYHDYLDLYDFTVVMSYPQMEGTDNSIEWIKNIVNISSKNKKYYDKVVFKLQSYNWKYDKWIDDSLLLKEIRTILSSGGRHIAYYPDNVFENKPDINILKLEMSTKSRPN